MDSNNKMEDDSLIFQWTTKEDVDRQRLKIARRLLGEGAPYEAKDVVTEECVTETVDENENVKEDSDSEGAVSDLEVGEEKHGEIYDDVENEKVIEVDDDAEDEKVIEVDDDAEDEKVIEVDDDMEDEKVIEVDDDTEEEKVIEVDDDAEDEKVIEVDDDAEDEKVIEVDDNGEMDDVKKESVPMSLRKNRKRVMRPSYEYDPIKKRTRNKKPRYCLCNQEEDDRKYWECEICERWFHPGCMDLSENDEPEHFLCRFCKQKIKNRIDLKYITSMTDDIHQHVQSIVSCDLTKCQNISHKRHHDFVKNPHMFYKENKGKICYGMDYFDPDTSGAVSEELMRKYIYNIPDPKDPLKGFWCHLIRGVDEGTRLNRIMLSHSESATNYLLYVLTPDVLSMVLARNKGIALDVANYICQDTEIKWRGAKARI